MLASDTLHHRLSRVLHNLGLAGLAAHALEMLKVVIFDRSNILTTEDADLESLCGGIARGERCARCLQIIQSLIDDGIGTDAFGNGPGVAVMCNKL